MAKDKDKKDKEPKLTLQKKKFCEEYYDRCHGEASAIAAGYPSKSARAKASQLLAEKCVKDYMKVLHDEARAAATVSRERLIQELEAIALANMDDYVSYKEGEAYVEPKEEEPDPDAKPVKAVQGDVSISYVASDHLTRSQKAAVSEIKDHPKTGFSIKLHSKIDAIKVLNSMQGYDAPIKTQQEVIVTQVEKTSFSIKARAEDPKE